MPDFQYHSSRRGWQAPVCRVDQDCQSSLPQKKAVSLHSTIANLARFRVKVLPANSIRELSEAAPRYFRISAPHFGHIRRFEWRQGQDIA